MIDDRCFDILMILLGAIGVFAFVWIIALIVVVLGDDD